MLQRRDEPILEEKNAYVFSITIVDDEADLLDKLHRQEVISVISSPIDDFHYVENVTNHQVVGYASQSHRDQEVEI